MPIERPIPVTRPIGSELLRRSAAAEGNSQSELSAFIQEFARHEGLSSRETEVLVLAALGMHRKEAADRLGCTTGTVDTYWRRIFKKTRVCTQAEIFVAMLARALDR